MTSLFRIALSAEPDAPTAIIKVRDGIIIGIDAGGQEQFRVLTAQKWTEIRPQCARVEPLKTLHQLKPPMQQYRRKSEPVNAWRFVVGREIPAWVSHHLPLLTKENQNKWFVQGSSPGEAVSIYNDAEFRKRYEPIPQRKPKPSHVS